MRRINGKFNQKKLRVNLINQPKVGEHGFGLINLLGIFQTRPSMMPAVQLISRTLKHAGKNILMTFDLKET